MIFKSCEQNAPLWSWEDWCLKCARKQRWRGLNSGTYQPTPVVWQAGTWEPECIKMQNKCCLSLAMRRPQMSFLSSNSGGRRKQHLGECQVSYLRHAQEKKKKERKTRCKEEILRMKHSLGSSYWRTLEVWRLNSSVVDLVVDVQQCWEPWSVVKGQMANTFLTPWCCYGWFTWGSLCVPNVYPVFTLRKKIGGKEALGKRNFLLNFSMYVFPKGNLISVSSLL